MLSLESNHFPILMLTLEPEKQDFELLADSAKKYRPSPFLIAFFLFVLANLLFYFVDARYVVSAKTRNERYFDFPGLRRLCSHFQNKRKQQILLLGSSLFVHPMRVIDKELAEKGGFKCSDLSCYHATADLDNRLRLSHVDCNNVCNLAVGGAMVSDYYLLFNKYISNRNKCPNVVVVDCAPRAFFDSGLVNANETPIFGYFFNCCDAFLLGEDYLLSPLSQIDFFAKYFYPLYGHRKWLINSLNEYLRSSLASNLLPNTAEAEAVLLKDLDRNKIDHKKLGSLREYKRHYAGISIEKIQTQMHFLDLLSQACSQKHIKLFILNMPLTSFNKNLLNGDFYSHYKNHLQIIAQNSGAEFCDLDSFDEYSDDDFEDSAHLNVSGGIKLENQIVNFIKNMESVAAEL